MLCLSLLLLNHVLLLDCFVMVVLHIKPWFVVHLTEVAPLFEQNSSIVEPVAVSLTMLCYS